MRRRLPILPPGTLTVTWDEQRGKWIIWRHRPDGAVTLEKAYSTKGEAEDYLDFADYIAGPAHRPGARPRRGPNGVTHEDQYTEET